MGILSWIILGGLAGWLASRLMNTREEMGGLKNVLVGILGAVIGGGLMNFFNRAGVESFSLYSLLVALLGSMILLAVFKWLKK